MSNKKAFRTVEAVETLPDSFSSIIFILFLLNLFFIAIIVAV